MPDLIIYDDCDTLKTTTLISKTKDVLSILVTDNVHCSNTFKN